MLPRQISTTFTTISPATYLNYAELFVDQLVSATDRIEAHPRIGRRVPEAGHRDDIRELIVQRYRVIYRVDVDGILILTIVHGSRDPERRGIPPWNEL